MQNAHIQNLTREEKIEKAAKRARLVLNKHHNGKITGMDCVIVETRINGRKPFFHMRFFRPNNYRLKIWDKNLYECESQNLFRLEDYEEKNIDKR